MFCKVVAGTGERERERGESPMHSVHVVHSVHVWSKGPMS